jgi:glycosyltransferase involved in cell wall biosynthesis
VAGRLIWHYKISQEELMPWIAGAEVSLAPLVECSRNLVQGCCPMKIIESMALEVPVIASNIPVVRELIEHGETGWLVRPDRPAELARAIRLLLTNPDRAKEIGKMGKEKFEKSLTWLHSKEILKQVYRTTLNDFKK